VSILENVASKRMVAPCSLCHRVGSPLRPGRRTRTAKPSSKCVTADMLPREFGALAGERRLTPLRGRPARAPRAGNAARALMRALSDCCLRRKRR
jgi:hypothetical protein